MCTRDPANQVLDSSFRERQLKPGRAKSINEASACQHGQSATKVSKVDSRYNKHDFISANLGSSVVALRMSAAFHLERIKPPVPPSSLQEVAHESTFASLLSRPRSHSLSALTRQITPPTHGMVKSSHPRHPLHLQSTHSNFGARKLTRNNFRRGSVPRVQGSGFRVKGSGSRV